MKTPYDDIIDLPHHVSATHPQMPMSDRAAQFSPFAALVGYDAAIRETGRLTEAKAEPDEEALRELDRRIRLLAERLGDGPEVDITYFLPDQRKAGGSYQSVRGVVKKIDDFRRIIVLRDGTGIPMDDVAALDWPAPETQN